MDLESRMLVYASEKGWKLFLYNKQKTHCANKQYKYQILSFTVNIVKILAKKVSKSTQYIY